MANLLRATVGGGTNLNDSVEIGHMVSGVHTLSEV